MLDGSPEKNDEANIGNVENNNPMSPVAGGDGSNPANKTRTTLGKKGGRKLLLQQKPARSSLCDHNNNPLTSSSANKAAAQPGPELPVGSQTVLTLHHLKQAAKKDVSFPSSTLGIGLSALELP